MTSIAAEIPSTPSLPNFGPLGTLRPQEAAWRDRFEFLKSRGYLLRPRYRPDWKPSWKAGRAARSAEDSFLLERRAILDATRTKDGMVVVLKHIKKDSPELSIGEYLSSEPMRTVPENHSVPILETLDLPDDAEYVIIVMPLLRRVDHPNPSTVRECLEFVDQVLEGLAFMHEHEISHRDCGMLNILMDARPMFRKGWHPSKYNFLPDGRRIPRWLRLTRSAAGGVRYYWIDFGLSSRGEELVTGMYGQDRSAPELSDTVPYDPYKLDVYVLGKVFESHLLQERQNIDFLEPFVAHMVDPNPGERPTAAECLTKFRLLRRTLPLRSIYCRSPSKTAEQPEGRFTKHIKDTYYLYCECFWFAKFLVTKAGSSYSFTT